MATFQELIEEHKLKAIPHTFAVKYKDNSYDLFDEYPNDCSIDDITLLTFNTVEGKQIFWHSSAHLLAQALKRCYPDIQLEDGPVIDRGPGLFYYDVYTKKVITEEDFEKIEKMMSLIVQEHLNVTRTTYTKKDAVDRYQKENQPFKVDILQKIKDDKVTFYTQGEFSDLCRGPHLPNTSLIKAIKLTAISGVYYKGDSSNPMLQRIYGVSFPTDKELKKYFHHLEEAKKRDHRKIGKELDLFSFQDEGPGFPFFHPNGVILYNTLIAYIQKGCILRGYKEIKTPTLLSQTLWEQSGHYANFRDNMYFTSIDEQLFAIKPMNCPGSNLVYKSSPHSYRDLPIKFTEFGTVYRHELSGALHGLFRVRSFTQDDAHVYCTNEQLEEEVIKIIEFTLDVYKKFDFTEITIYIATRPEKSIGSPEAWENATDTLKRSLTTLGLKYQIKDGEGAFYGPKIEFNIQDCLGRDWQCGTIQVDFSMPERFDLKFKASDGDEYRPVMIHRAIFGSIERFLGILIEHYNGKFPFWLAPEQVRVLTVNEEVSDYAENIYDQLLKNQIRVTKDFRDERISYKIREWNTFKVCDAVIIGANEMQNKTISLRERGAKNTLEMPLKEYLDLVKNRI